MDVVVVLAVGVRREHHAESLAGAARDVAQEIAFRAAAAPVPLDADGSAVDELEAGDVERVAVGVLAPAMLAAGLAPARIGADLMQRPHAPSEMGEGGGLHVLAREASSRRAKPQFTTPGGTQAIPAAPTSTALRTAQEPDPCGATGV
jgi:hypothetical protein